MTWDGAHLPASRNDRLDTPMQGRERVGDIARRQVSACLGTLSSPTRQSRRRCNVLETGVCGPPLGLVFRPVHGGLKGERM